MSGRLPYPGLRAFRRDESDLFFGREGHVDAMVDRLTATRFLAVLGPSGGGKSSLVRTGLLDALDLGYSSAGAAWCVADMHPGGQPIRNLARAALSSCGRSVDDIDVDLLADLLLRGPRAFVEWVAAGNLAEDHNLLILVDQFEELFRYADCAGREEAESFVKTLLEAARDRDVPIFVCITMRSEYLGACALVPGLAEAINRGGYLTPRLSRDQCNAAIVGPAGVCGFDVEPALVNKILNDMAAMAPWTDGSAEDHLKRLSQRADQLPLMQHVLNRMWILKTALGRDDERLALTRSDYDALGGLKGALDSHGEEILAGLPPGGRSTAERVFRALTSGSSLETAVRRPCRLSDLVAEQGGDGAIVLEVVEAFRAPSANFLQPPYPVAIDDDTHIDISHESLIRQWSTLAAWFQTEAQSSANWRDLISASRRYREGRANLLSGLDLAQASVWWSQERPTAEWAARHGGQFEEIRDFVLKSEALRDEAAEAARLKSVRERNRLRLQLAASVAVTLLVSALGLFSWNLYQTAAAQKAEVEQQRAKAAELANDLGRKQLRLVQTQRELSQAVLTARSEARARALEAARAQEQGARAEQASRAARTAELEAQREAERSRKQIEEIGNIIVGSDSSFETSSTNLRRELARALARRIPRFATFEPAEELPASQLRRRIAEILSDHLRSLADRPSTLIRDEDRLANLFRLQQVYERSGDVGRRREALRKAWSFVAPRLELENWRLLSPADRRLTMEVAYDVAWGGQNWGMDEETETAHRGLRNMGSQLSPESQEVAADPALAIILANYENLEADRHSSISPPRPELSHWHAERALNYSGLALRSATGSEEFAISPFAIRDRQAAFAQNLVQYYGGREYQTRAQEACAIADHMFNERPDDERALRRIVYCPRPTLQFDAAYRERLLRAVSAIRSGLANDPSNQTLRQLLLEASARLTDGGGCNDCAEISEEAVDGLKRLIEDGYEFYTPGEALAALRPLHHESREVRLRTAQRLIPVLQRRLHHTGGAAFETAISELFEIAAGADSAAAEVNLYRAVQFHRTGSPATRQPWDECRREGSLLSLQRDRKSILDTVRFIRRYCGGYLQQAPWDIGFRNLLGDIYEEAQFLTEDSDVNSEIRKFLEMYGRDGSSAQPFRATYVWHASDGPVLFSISIYDWDENTRSPVDDLEAMAYFYGHNPRPASVFRFLRMAREYGARTDQSLPNVANIFWEEALGSSPYPENEEELESTYNRAIFLLQSAMYQNGGTDHLESTTGSP